LIPFESAVERELGALPFIAEDLGFITPDVYTLRDQFHLPGMRILQFAFDGHSDNPYLPENYVSNTVVYSGTHDNPPSRCWYESLPTDQRANVSRYLNSTATEVEGVAPQLIQMAWSSPAALAIAPLQDVLNLGCEARMNVPGRADGNWTWRCSEGLLTGPTWQSLLELTSNTNRRTII
jgi:4-alpha-glucanotransferase